MKQAMEGTFFDRWLLMSGWMSKSNGSINNTANTKKVPASCADTPCEKSSSFSSIPYGNRTETAAPSSGGILVAGRSSPDIPKKRSAEECANFHGGSTGNDKRPNVGDAVGSIPNFASVASTAGDNNNGRNIFGANITGQAELERLIRAIAANPSLTAMQKNTTIQGLRDSVWKSNQLQRRNSQQQLHSFAPQDACVMASDVGSTAATGIKIKRSTPPAMYTKKNDEGKVEFVWSR